MIVFEHRDALGDRDALGEGVFASSGGGVATVRKYEGRHLRFIAATTTSIVLSWHSSALSADNLVHRYSIRLAGLPIGSAMLDASLMPERYAAKFSADIGWLGVGYHVQGESAGRRSGPRLTPESFKMVIPGRASRTITMQFAGESVSDFAITPPIAPDDLSKRVPITSEQLKHVMDPLAALISKSFMMDRNAGELCRGSTSVFVGFARFDLRLEPKTQPAKGTPRSVSCRVIYRPVAGHRAEEPTAAGLAASRDIEVTFQWGETESMWAVSRITLPIQLGYLVVQRRH